MPKRRTTVASSGSEDGPKKVTRRGPKSPVKNKGDGEIMPPPPPPVQQLTEPSGGLLNVSDDEDMDVVAPVPQEEKKKRGQVVQLKSLKDWRGFRNRYFETFVSDIIEREEHFRVDVERYRKLCDEIPDDDMGEQKAMVDQFMRDFIIEESNVMGERWDNFFQLSIFLAQQQICSASLPITLISDFLELNSLDRCEDVFYFVEQKIDVWKEPFFLNSGKNSVLRMCNDLLRRLSRAQNTIFCGRILMFLSNYFPLSERSGLNIMSEFNTENVTTYKKNEGSDDPEDQMDTTEERDEKLFEGVDIVIPGLDKIAKITQEEKKNRVKVDYNLYVKFWSLQDFFRNPTQCYNKVSWKSFAMYIQDVLGAFSSYKIEGNPSVPVPKDEEELQNKSHSSINVIPKLGDEDLFFPKYLTNRRLLELQMGDPSFRKYFLVQLLIIFQYLSSPVKFKSENQVLSDDQADYIRKTTDRIFSLLKDMKPGGKEFVKAVQHVLKREDMWSKWKNDGCQPFKKPVGGPSLEGGSSSSVDAGGNGDSLDVPAPAPTKKKRKKHLLSAVLSEAHKNKRYVLGNPELTRLWNICGDNLQACRAATRDFLPRTENFFADAFQELDPDPTVPHILQDPSKREVKQKKNLSNANFGWRALRLLARNSPYFFQLAPSAPIQPLQNYLEYILKKVAADMDIATPTTVKTEAVENPKKNPQAVPKPNGNGNDADQVVDAVADAENDELLKSAANNERGEEEEEGEVDEKVRNLTEEEEKTIGGLLKDHWKKVALKLQFTKDEIEFFDTSKGKEAGCYMLKMWREQEKEDATLADLLYQLEGLKLRHLVQELFPV